MALAPSSPRLPSPPPPAEIQIGPKSPSGGPPPSLATTELEQSLLDANSKRRIHPGTKAEDIAVGPPLVALNELDSAFQLQEHLAALHNSLSASGTKPIDRDTAYQLAQPPPGIDRTLWLYELCRFLISQCNSLIVGFLFDAPPCSASTCPEMRASEWQFLCAVHEQPKSCCAIDYCCHTLDWAANVVTDQKLFPSRFVVLSDAHSKNVGVKNLVNVFRRLHRIFAHAWFQHRSVFWSVEGQTGLYVFFKTVCDLFDLLPAENYKLPPEAEGLEAPPSEPEPEKPVPAILKPPSQQQRSQISSVGDEDDNPHHSVSRTNTRRHIRSSPSTGSAVTTVIEAAEEEDNTAGVTQKVRELQISAPETVAEEPETADVPMMVEEESVLPKEPNAEPKPEEEKEEEPESEVSDADQTVVEDSAPPEEPEQAEATATTSNDENPEDPEPVKNESKEESETPVEPTVEAKEEAKETDDKKEESEAGSEAGSEAKADEK